MESNGSASPKSQASFPDPTSVQCAADGRALRVPHACRDSQTFFGCRACRDTGSSFFCSQAESTPAWLSSRVETQPPLPTGRSPAPLAPPTRECRRVSRTQAVRQHILHSESKVLSTSLPQQPLPHMVSPIDGLRFRLPMLCVKVPIYYPFDLTTLQGLPSEST